MKSYRTSTYFQLLGIVALAAIAFSIDAHVLHIDAAGALLALAPGAVAMSFGRIREPMKPFSNVAVSTIATAKIPRYNRTVLGLELQRGGTTFANSDISRVEVFLGEKSIYGPVSGTEIAAVTQYTDDKALDTFFLPVDFTLPNIKEIGGEFLGGIDLSQLPDGEIRVEVEIGSGASAPTLVGHIIWGQPQGDSDLAGLMLKLIKRTYPQMASGDNFPSVVLRDCLVARQFFRYTVATAAVATAAGQGAAFANTGNGVMGAIAVAADTPVGRYRLVFTQAIANAGCFSVFDPRGVLIGSGNVAVAFAGGGLSFTLADGATDYLAGDGFTIDVLPSNTDGNLNLVEVKKNEIVQYSRSARAANYEQLRYGRRPLAKMMVVDFVQDNHIDSLLDVSDATTASLDYKINFTSADTPTIIHQVLAKPIA